MHPCLLLRFRIFKGVCPELFMNYLAIFKGVCPELFMNYLAGLNSTYILLETMF